MKYYHLPAQHKHINHNTFGVLLVYCFFLHLPLLLLFLKFYFIFYFCLFIYFVLGGVLFTFVWGGGWGGNM